MAEVTEQQIQDVLDLYERQRQERIRADAAEALRKAQDTRDVLLAGRLTWACGPCRNCVVAILRLLPVDRAACLGR
jgi:hypothetical protein